MARVSLGLPVYNGEKFVRQALESVLAQTFGDFQLFISDNASDDSTGDICREYASIDGRIQYSRNSVNLGHAPNFCRVFRETKAPYFKWVVHDDVLEPGYLAACVRALDEAGDAAVLAYPRTTLIDDKGGTIERFEDRMDLRDRAPSRRLARFLRDFRLGHCGLGLIRREVLEQTSLIGPYEHSDIVTLVELLLRGEFREVPEYLYRRRIHGESSFGSYTSPQDFLLRMDPSRKASRVVMPRTNLIARITRAIGAAPISMTERVRCEVALARVWGPRFWRVVAGEFRVLLTYPWRRLRGDHAGRGVRVKEPR